MHEKPIALALNFFINFAHSRLDLPVVITSSTINTLAFFFNPNWDVLSTPLPGCLDEKNPLKFEITTFYNHLCNYVDRNYSLSSGGKALDA